MRPLVLALGLCLAPLAAAAQTGAQQIISRVVDQHILPGYAALEHETGALATVAQGDCNALSPDLRAAFGTALDAWIRVSHLAFGPAEAENRLFSLSFWPDQRGMTPRSLIRLIENADPVIDSAEGFATVSIAARGFYALEFLLYDAQVMTTGSDAYRCALVQAVTQDIHRTAQQIDAAWRDGFADLMRNAGQNDRYRSDAEALSALLGALGHGLEYTADLRLGRPLGTFDAPRPLRAEARRSGRSLRHVQLALESLAGMAALMVPDKDGVGEAVMPYFDAAIQRAQELDDPVFVGVTEPQEYLRIEDLQRRVRDALAAVQTTLAPALGVAAGFNAMDGD
ncbi:MAG: imelysin family protein [Pararhodobacter sp.]|nr:imelysin family protein [Pararhodobacter sp.]